MTGLERIQETASGYIAEAERLEREKKPTDGLFGMGSKPADDPCHDRFAADLEAVINDIAAQGAASSDAREMLSFIYSLASEHREPVSIYWMLCAVHGLTMPLIGLLDAEDAAALSRDYAFMFRRWERLPVQNNVYKTLRLKGKT